MRFALDERRCYLQSHLSTASLTLLREKQLNSASMAFVEALHHVSGLMLLTATDGRHRFLRATLLISADQLPEAPSGICQPKVYCGTTVY